MKKLIGFAIAAVVLVGVMYSTKGQDNADIKADALALVEQFDGYGAQPEEYLRIFDIAHEDAFASAYQMRGRRSAAELDVDLYWEELTSRMITRAQFEKMDDIAGHIEATLKRWAEEEASYESEGVVEEDG